jgi:[ribosomal protein S5]-alanine N-acetyltransferase
VLAGDLGGLDVAAGWPHEDTAPGLSFLDSGGEVFLIVDDEGRVTGECGTKGPPNDTGVVEIGYGLAGPSRGRGLGSAAVAALVDRLAGDPAVRAIEAEVHVGNVPSIRVIERLGFHPSQPPHNGYVRYLLECASQDLDAANG